MAAAKKIQSTNKWYEEPIKKWFALLSGFIFIASLGYAFALIQKNLEFKMERIELKQEFNERLQEQIIKCKEEQQEVENKKIEALETVVKEIQSNSNGRKK